MPIEISNVVPQKEREVRINLIPLTESGEMVDGVPSVRFSELIDDNPAFAIIDRSEGGILDRMLGDKFIRKVYDEGKPRIVRVEDRKSKTGYRWLPFDHHRIIAAQEHVKTEKGWDWTAQAVDVTEQYAEDGKNYISRSTYREIVNSSEIRHAEFLVDRMIMHVLRDWPDSPMSALAALSFLSFSSLQDKPLKQLDKGLQSSGRLMVGETDEQRAQVIAGIKEVAKEIKSIRPPKSYSDFGHPAFDVMASNLTSEELRAQIEGFYVLPPVEHKLKRDGEVSQDRKDRLTTLIIDVIGERRDVQDTRALFQTLTDNEFSYNDVLQILTTSPDSLNTRYRAHKKKLKGPVVASSPPKKEDVVFPSAGVPVEAPKPVVEAETKILEIIIAYAERYPQSIAALLVTFSETDNPSALTVIDAFGKAQEEAQKYGIDVKPYYKDLDGNLTKLTLNIAALRKEIAKERDLLGVVLDGQLAAANARAEEQANLAESFKDRADTLAQRMEELEAENGILTSRLTAAEQKASEAVLHTERSAALADENAALQKQLKAKNTNTDSVESDHVVFSGEQLSVMSLLDQVTARMGEPLEPVDKNALVVFSRDVVDRLDTSEKWKKLQIDDRDGKTSDWFKGFTRKHTEDIPVALRRKLIKICTNNVVKFMPNGRKAKDWLSEVEIGEHTSLDALYEKASIPLGKVIAEKHWTRTDPEFTIGFAQVLAYSLLDKIKSLEAIDQDVPDTLFTAYSEISDSIKDFGDTHFRSKGIFYPDLVALFLFSSVDTDRTIHTTAGYAMQRDSLAIKRHVETYTSRHGMDDILKAYRNMIAS